MTFLSEFSQEAIASHALITVEIINGDQPSADLLRELGAEVLAIDKLATLTARQVTTILPAHDCWQTTVACFQACLDIWDRLPVVEDDRLTGHGRLLKRLLRNAEDRSEFYAVTDRDRAAFNAGRDLGLPLELASENA